MVAARNLEQQMRAGSRSDQRVLGADTPFAGMPSAQLYGVNPYQGLPRYDSRFARRYARNIMAQAGYFAELDAEMRAMTRNDNARLADYRSDAGLSLAFARSLEYIIRKPYEAEYPELRAPEFIPLMTEVPPEALTFTYRMLDKMGVAAIINENGSDSPKVDLKAEEWQQPIVTLGASYDYTILDTMRAARLGIPLEAYKAEAARFACEYLNEKLAAVGNANAGLVGLTNAPGVAAVTQVSSGGSWVQQIASIGTASTTNATPPAVVVAQGIISDFNAMISTVFTGTDGIHRPDTALVSVAAYAALMTAPRSPGFTDDTLLEYIEKACQINIECWPQLNTAGALTVGGLKGRVMVYKKDPKILSLVVAQPFTQLPPQPVKMAWEVQTYMRTGAVQVRFPKAVVYMDGVS